MATCSGGWLGVIFLSRWLTTANGLSRLIGVVVLGTLAYVVTRLSTLEACHNIGAWSSISSGATTARGHVNYVSAEETHEDPNVVLGTLLVNCHPATVLFDTGASHSFISESYARLHNTTFSDMPTSMEIQTPGSRWHTSRISYGNEILVDRLVFLASLIALKSSDINII